MNTRQQAPAAETDELLALATSLNDQLERLESLTGGEVDTVVDAHGRSFLLRRAQNELRQREAVRQAAILDALPAQVALLDGEGVIISANQSWRSHPCAGEAHGPGHAIGIDYLALCEQATGEGAAESHQVASGLRGVMEGGTTEFSLEYPSHASGAERWTLVTATPLPDQSTHGAVVTHFDITDRKQVQEALDELARKTEKRERILSTTLGAIVDSAYIFDRDGRFLFANRAVSDPLGLDEGAMVGRNYFDVGYPPDLATTLKGHIEEVISSGRVLTDVTPFVDATGRRGLYEYILSPVLAADGTVEYVAGSTRDITSHDEIKKQNSTLIGELQEKSRQLEEANLALRQDIAERELAEAALRESEAEFVHLTEAMPQIVWMTTADGANTFFNQQWVDYTGLSQAESRGDGWIVPFHPDDKLRAWEAWTQATASIGTYSIEVRLRRADGSYRWWLVRGVPFADADGNILKWFGTCTDIHELKATEERFRATFENAAVGIAHTGFDERFLQVNQKLCDMVGYTAQEFQSLTTRDLLHPDDLAEHVSLSARLLAGDIGPDGYVMEKRCLCKDGATLWTRGTLSVARDDEGKPLYCIRVIEDISERRQAEDERLRNEAALREAECLSRATIDALTKSLCVLDETGTIIRVNKAWRDFAEANAGDPRSICEGANYLAVCGGGASNEDPDAAAFAAGIRSVAAGERNEFSMEYPCHSANEQRWFLGRVTGFEGDGARRAVVTHENITRRKEAELALITLNEELERKVAERTEALEVARNEAVVANRAKSDFLATMSHEIRTPMNGVVGMIEVLQQSSLRGDQVEMVDLIGVSAFSLLQIINDILDFSKIEAGKLELECETFALEPVVDGVARLLDEMAQKKGVTLTLFVDPAIPTHVAGDALRLRQVLTNLLNNAIKFSSGQPRPGRVSLRAVLVEHNPRQSWVDIQVTDNGIGMDAKARAGLFRAFSQADASTTRRFGGTGLGLAIVDRLVKLMGGEITVQSAAGEGSSFRVRLPFGTVPLQADGEALPSELAGLSCVVVGKAGGLADDLATYLADAQAHVERVPDLASARQWQVGRSDLSVWIVDADQQSTPTGQLQAADRIDEDVHFLLVLVQRGKRRRPRAVGSNTIVVDGNALNRRTFLGAVAAAAGRASLEVEATDPFSAKGAVIAPSRDQALREHRLVLVAEDNENNRKVITHQLALLGYAADVAPDGREAWRLWNSGQYALLLTDLHMPHMDGYELARAIRSSEVPGAHLPIIALTANALKGEDRRCRAVGMDDYLSKPVSLMKLKAVLDGWLQGEGDANAMVVSADGPALSGQSVTPGSVDVDVLRALVGDDPTVVNDFLIDFRDGAATLAAELRAACATSQPTRAADTAHKLKSSARAVGALALAELCETIESEGKAGNADRLAALLPAFDVELASVENSVDLVTRSPGGGRGNPRDPSDVIDNRAAHVLIVDDELFMLDLNRRVLSNLGFTEITTCDSARHALDVMDTAAQPVDLILLDLNMPDIDGVQFVRHLVERGYQGSLILVSGEDERMLQAAEKLVQSHLITTLGHLHKPLEPRRLVQLMQHWKPAARSGHRSVPGEAATKAARKEYTADEVRSAIANGELVNYYQPQVSLTTGELTGVETLVRWRHPLDGLVYPDRFIGVAEANGLASDLTRSVIAGSLAQASSYRRQTGLAFPMAINVSMEDLGNLNFADDVEKAAEAAGVPAHEVTLEVTESQLMQDLRGPLEVLTRLRMKRFRLSIDDFGTGHSNLSQLRDMPFHELKIDRGFVHGAGADPTLRAIFDASVTLAKQLGMQIVAEGVEDQADWDIVRRAGCDAAQGYFIARPMPAEQLPDWIASWKERALVAS